ncbi:sigma factor [Actinacidiphila acididurans]|uniref:sigma factor n=1 Tax=Actinacidiphila acididurans TaxID=2784346 RepID=UPI0035574BB2
MAGGLAEGDWESHRPAVFGAAHRILGTGAEAEDVTQEVWLRAAAADLSKARDLRACTSRSRTWRRSNSAGSWGRSAWSTCVPR